ncbi:MAG: FAD-dependent oxidoreductase [Verrucomicrobia bacterium]|nr:FAD-dependent oxidoreductase [Verrucomicrobiota bacterium]
MNIPASNYPRIVIVGGGFGGLQLARTLKGKRFQLLMLDQNNYHTFQPLLYQVATAGLEPDSIAYPLRKIFNRQSNLIFRMAEVQKVNTDKKIIFTNIGELEYDYLVIATGSTTNFFGKEDVAKHAMPMKSVSEALNLRSLMLQNFEKALLVDTQKEQEALMSFAIVGAGPTGVELAGALAELKKHVLPSDYPDLDIRRMSIHLIDMAEEVLPPMSDKASAKAFEYLEEMGVTLWMGQSVESYDGETIQFKKAKPLASKTLIWAAGVKGNLVEGISEAAVLRGRYKVNAYNALEGIKDVYAIGDVAWQTNTDFPNGLPMVAQVAIQQGKNLGINIKAKAQQKTQKEFKYKDLGSMATIGRNKAVADLGKLKLHGLFAWFVWMFIHLIALVGFRNKVITFFNWSYNYLNFDRGVRLIIRKFEKT